MVKIKITAGRIKFEKHSHGHDLEISYDEEGLVGKKKVVEIEFGKHWPEQIKKEDPNIFSGKLKVLPIICKHLDDVEGSLELKCAVSKRAQFAVWQYHPREPSTINSSYEFFQDLKKELEAQETAFDNQLFYSQLVQLVAAFLFIYPKK